MVKAADEKFRKVQFGHFLLGGLYVVIHPKMRNSIVIAVIQDIAGAGIVVTGLAHTSGIYNKPVLCQFYGCVILDLMQ